MVPRGRLSLDLVPPAGQGFCFFLMLLSTPIGCNCINICIEIHGYPRMIHTDISDPPTFHLPPPGGSRL